jgi:hypothetical protein
MVYEAGPTGYGLARRARAEFADHAPCAEEEAFGQRPAAGTTDAPLTRPRRAERRPTAVPAASRPRRVRWSLGWATTPRPIPDAPIRRPRRAPVHPI